MGSGRGRSGLARRVAGIAGIAVLVGTVAASCGCDPAPVNPLGCDSTKYPQTVCVYLDDNFKGNIRTFSGEDHDYGNDTWDLAPHDQDGGPNDNVTSIVNDSGAYALFHERQLRLITRLSARPAREYQHALTAH